MISKKTSNSNNNCSFIPNILLPGSLFYFYLNLLFNQELSPFPLCQMISYKHRDIYWCHWASIAKEHKTKSISER